ncbi:hypothetical protein TNCT_403291 [Trichonephila clavata]|uniref:Uncharacterized protein n=1 Tax=Trichonephila clavata TaxID=2740835 RepID=A0A8X6HD53_TRICU|nr:hypothetical protein TNCT_403291 [Trichonephila clavata]
MDPLKQGNSDAHSKSPYTKAGPSRIKCPDLISRATFRAIPPGPIHYSTSCVLICPGQQRTFQDNNAVLNPWTQWKWFPTVHLYSTIQCLNLSMDSRIPSEQKMHPSHKKQWFKMSMNIL